MKIVSLSTKDSLGGAAKVAYRLHQEVLKSDIDEIFLVSNKRVDDPTIHRAASYYTKQKHFFPLYDRYSQMRSEKKRIEKWDRYLSTRRDVTYLDLEISLMRDALKNIDFDLLQMHWVGESYMDMSELTGIDVPVVWTLHDCFPFTGICTHFEDCHKFKTHCGNCPQLGSGHEKDFSYETFEKKIERYQSVDFHIVCPSNWLANHARESKLLGHYPIHVIPNGIDTEYFYPINKIHAKSALGLPLNKKIILFGGVRVDGDYRKGGRLLEKALQHLEDNVNDEFELLVLGTNKLNLNIKSHITCLGYVDKEYIMRMAYAAADVTVVPSMYENLPTMIMESLSCGTPVSAFNIGGNADMVDHLENGYLAKAYEEEDLARGIEFCLKNNNENKLGVNARNKVLAQFKIEDVTQKYISLYKSILR